MPTNVFPVIHHCDNEITLRNAAIVADAGCIGLFLIQMNARDGELDAPAQKIKKRWPKMLLGINRLSCTPQRAIKWNNTLGVKVTWNDQLVITSKGVSQNAKYISGLLGTMPNHRLFTSVAFKYQAHEPDPAKAAQLVAGMGPQWIVTTSGAATGEAPDVEKLKMMKEAIGQSPLAVASGISLENAKMLFPYVDCALVSTHLGCDLAGGRLDFYNFDAKKLALMMEIARNSPAAGI